MKIRMILVGGLAIIIIFLLFGFFNFSSQSQSQTQSQITEGMENNCSSIETSIEKQVEEQCSPFYLFKNTAHTLIPPNIPVDPQTKYKIGGRYCDNIGGKSLTYQKGKYIFPIPELLYDGIYQSRGCIDDKTSSAIRKWKLLAKTQCSPTDKIYTTNKYFHLPEKDLQFAVVDENMFYNDLDKLGACTQNQLCEGEDIVPLEPDASAFCRRVHHPMLLQRGSGLARRTQPYSPSKQFSR